MRNPPRAALFMAADRLSGQVQWPLVQTIMRGRCHHDANPDTNSAEMRSAFRHLLCERIQVVAAGVAVAPLNSLADQTDSGT